ncbi:MAG: TIM barrel protein [archaeon]
MIRFGPSGLGGKSEAITILESYAKQGLKACEVAFTYGVYLDKESAEEIGKKAKELDIYLSIHAPYYINLNSEDKAKIEASKKRILDCCEIGHYLSADSKHKTPIVFHAGFYSKLEPAEAFQNIKKEIVELMGEIEKKKFNVILCPEVMGKINVFGSIEEISKLVEETGCGFCIDFAHVLARYDKNNFELIESNFGKAKEWHCHFSGIVYGDKGEKNHKHTEKTEWRNLFVFLKTQKKEITIISEAPNPVGDAVEGSGIFSKL